MTYIYSITSLTTKQREVKEAARQDIVHITENGNGAFVFCSEEIFEKALEEARGEAAYEAQMLAAVDRGMEDIEAGKAINGLDEFKKQLGEARRKRA